MIKNLIPLILILVSCQDYSSDLKLPANPVADNAKMNKNEDLAKLDPNSGEFTENKMLINIGRNVISKIVFDFYFSTQNLKNKASAVCNSKDKNIKVLKPLWKESMLSFHKLETVAIGPLASKSKDLKSWIYSWPFINVCGVEQDVLSLKNNTPLELSNNRMGLGALEYLLFSSFSKSACNLNANPKIANWVMLSEQEKNIDICKSIVRVSEKLESDSREIFLAWSPEFSDYTSKLVDGSVFSSSKEAINALTNSLFFLDRVKDLKLGALVGKHASCLNEKCPELAEHKWSQISTESIQAHLEMFQLVFTGGEGFGFDDYLSLKSSKSIANDILSKIDLVFKNISDLPQDKSLMEIVNNLDIEKCKNNEESICDLHKNLKELVNIFKVDMLTALSLDMPAHAQGDND